MLYVSVCVDYKSVEFLGVGELYNTFKKREGESAKSNSRLATL